MKVTRIALEAMLNKNVVELRFSRRHLKPGWKQYRRMLCTNNTQLLYSAPGRIALNYQPPSRSPPFVPAHYNLVNTWDIFWQDYRNISCDAVDVVTMIPLTNEEEADKFWNYFNLYLESMSPQQKMNFMNT